MSARGLPLPNAWYGKPIGASGPFTHPVRLLAFAVVLAWLLVGAFVRPLSPDEGQYLAATWFVSSGLLPYEDFAYLQTPLQPLIFAPLNWLFAGHLFVAARIANALLGFATVLLVYATARRMGAGPGAALLGAILLPTCYPFLWAGVGRNDMLPAALLALGLWLCIASEDRWRLIAAGAAFSLAAGVKISYALPAAAIFTVLLISRDPGMRRNALWLAVGQAIGLIPTVALALVEFRAFLFEAVRFPAQAPLLWYQEIGQGHRLGADRFLHLLKVSARGPALLAVVFVIASWARDRERWSRDRGVLVLAAATLAGLVSAVLNRPFHPPYLIPALPPLFVLLALSFDRIQRPRPVWLLIWAVSVALGLSKGISYIVQAADDEVAPALAIEGTSRELGQALHAAQVRGPVATLHGEHVVDSGYALDRRFAAGPFLFRTRGMVTAAQAREWDIATRELRIGGAKSPGAFIIRLHPGQQRGPDAWLSAQAARLGYVQIATVRGFLICAPRARRPTLAMNSTAAPQARPCLLRQKLLSGIRRLRHPDGR